MAVRKPRFPRLTAKRGMSAPSRARAADSSVPSPPRTINSCEPCGTLLRGTPAAPPGIKYAAVSGSQRTLTPRSASHITRAGTTRAASSLRGLEMMPAVVMLPAGFADGIKQELPIALGAEDGTLDDISPKALGLHRGPNPVTSGLMQRGLAHDSTFADLAALHFKLG